MIRLNIGCASQNCSGCLCTLRNISEVNHLNSCGPVWQHAAIFWVYFSIVNDVEDIFEGGIEGGDVDVGEDGDLVE